MADGPRGWLLDTNVVSELRKGGNADPGVRSWAEAVPPAACFLSLVTVVEIRFGIERVADLQSRGELEAWLRDGVRIWFGDRVLVPDEAVLMTCRRLVMDGQKARYTYSQPDALIAATALVHGLGVVTRNIADFERAGLVLANPWTGPD
ncbi:type II toxin-antitoxin system VapC family toxin [Lichenicola cladoniae]|uniref:Type II toxin-antitoxin system VapC family toxin n=1 Tax=Lichenicola cladoniae TaxID=1484109 RepID=A0A6M8HRY0_9PROT|nr:type II toxin-antitoxin system VapC family toxin [Lichenicola cladoniae]NPD69130.1 type II toxin-antitoxin system VapC family toxin [Acetobacteraceae bacterium]QKE90951.1 type II toxin-antitoxin system VapC family toxin [Lichenicola cladoniae]